MHKCCISFTVSCSILFSKTVNWWNMSPSLVMILSSSPFNLLKQTHSRIPWFHLLELAVCVCFPLWWTFSHFILKWRGLLCYYLQFTFFSNALQFSKFLGSLLKWYETQIKKASKPIKILGDDALEHNGHGFLLLINQLHIRCRYPLVLLFYIFQPKCLKIDVLLCKHPLNGRNHFDFWQGLLEIPNFGVSTYRYQKCMANKVLNHPTVRISYVLIENMSSNHKS